MFGVGQICFICCYYQSHYIQNGSIIVTERRLVLVDGYEKHTVLFCCTQCFDLFQRQDRECLNSAGGLYALLILF